MGGVLFIDEIYRLAEGGQNDFGKEAVGEILTAVENCRGDFVAILAGYESNMKEFFDMNDGLPSRFPTTLHFADYNASEMYEIFKGMCEKGQFIISEAAHSKIKMALERMYANRDPVKFGNAREVRNLFERVQKNLKLRLYNDKKAGHTLTTNDLMTILEQDVPAM